MIRKLSIKETTNVNITTHRKLVIDQAIIWTMTGDINVNENNTLGQYQDNNLE